MMLTILKVRRMFRTARNAGLVGAIRAERFDRSPAAHLFDQENPITHVRVFGEWFDVVGDDDDSLIWARRYAGTV